MAGESVVKKGGWQGLGEGAATVVTEDDGDQAVLLGGSNAPEAAQIWHPALEDGAVMTGQVTTAFSARLVGDAESDDTFNWTVYAPDGQPIAALRLSALNGSLQAVNAAGESVMLDSVLERDCEHRFEIEVDLDEKTWSVILDGVVILERSPMGWAGEQGPSFGDAAAAWEPGPAEKPAGMVFDDFDISISLPEVEGEAGE